MPPDPAPLRLACLNILHGRSLSDGQVAAGRLASACASLGADVLCLQEVDRGQDRSGGADQVRAIAEAVGAAAWRFEPALVGQPGADWRAAVDGDADGCEPAYGVGIVSRRPVRSWWAVRLAAARVRAPVAVPGGRGRFILLPDEPRVALVAHLDGIAVATTHLSFVPGHNLRQLRTVTRAMDAAIAGPRVLMGDLNFPGRLPSVVSGWRSLARVRTFPAQRPSMQIDHALAAGPLPPVLGSRAVLLAVSDHRALVVDLRLGASAPSADGGSGAPVAE